MTWITVWFFATCSISILMEVVLEFEGQNNILYNIGFGIGHFFRSIINLF